MLSLFEDDSANFLDDITGETSAGQTMPGMGTAQGMVQVQQNMNYGQMQVPGQMAGMQGMQQQQQQQQQFQTYNQYNQYGSNRPQLMGAAGQGQGMATQGQAMTMGVPGQAMGMPTAQGQVMGQAMAMSNQGAMAMSGQAPNLISASPQPPQQFGSPPPAGAPPIQSPQTSYSSYSMHNATSPGLTPPRQPTPQPQQLGLSQSPAWNQSPGSQHSGSMSSSPYGSTPTRPMAPSYPAQSSGTYLSHHDYALPANNAPGTAQAGQQRLGHFPDQQQAVPGQQTNPYGPPTMGSPPPATRLTHMPMTANNGMSINRPQRAMNAGAGMMQAQQTTANMNMSGMNNPRQAGFVQGQAAQAQMAGNTFQHMGYQQQGQGMVAPQQQTADTPRLSHFSQNTGQSSQFQQAVGYNSAGIVGQQPQVAGQSQVVTVNMSGQQVTAQGNYQQQTTFHQPVSNVASFASVQQQQPQQQQPQQQTVYTMANMNVMTQQIASSTTQSFTGQTMQSIPSSNSVLNVNNQRVVGMGQMSPNVGMQPQQQQSQSVLANQQANMEIQQLQQQINQLVKMPQNPQTQENMLSLQERVRTLKAQQQQQILQQQRQQQMMQQQQIKIQQQNLSQPQQQQQIAVVQPVKLQQQNVQQQSMQPVKITVLPRQAQQLKLAGTSGQPQQIRIAVVSQQQQQQPQQQLRLAVAPQQQQIRIQKVNIQGAQKVSKLIVR